LNNEVVRLYEQGRYPEATAKARQALAIHKEVLGERHPDIAASLIALGCWACNVPFRWRARAGWSRPSGMWTTRRPAP